jgi:hypothetical protein
MALKTGITKVVSGLKWTNKDSTKLGRSFASIALKASNPRVFTEEAKKKMSESHKKRFTPRGQRMVG